MTKDPWIWKKPGEVGEVLESVSPSSNTVDLSGFPGILVESMDKEKWRSLRPLKISIDAEYFRSKFQDVLENHMYGFIQCEIPEISPIIEDLIECLKNAESK